MKYITDEQIETAASNIAQQFLNEGKEGTAQFTALAHAGAKWMQEQMQAPQSVEVMTLEESWKRYSEDMHLYNNKETIDSVYKTFRNGYEAGKNYQPVEDKSLDDCIKLTVINDYSLESWEQLVRVDPDSMEGCLKKAAELYASQFKAKSDQLQTELEQVKAERDAYRSGLLSIREAAWNKTTIHAIANKALQSTKQ